MLCAWKEGTDTERERERENIVTLAHSERTTKQIKFGEGGLWRFGRRSWANKKPRFGSQAIVTGSCDSQGRRGALGGCDAVFTSLLLRTTTGYLFLSVLN